jgi:MoaA/NifB/PqqE/SkfB family radical SAM enzyme
MYNYSEIKTIHLELTEKCNAACPMCLRNINGGEENPWLGGHELKLSDIQKIFTKEFISQLDHVYMCGNYGDPIVNEDCLEIFRYFREHNNNLILSMNTNGSARNIEFWSELAKIIGGNGFVIFGIDGLEDTHSIYRKNTIFDKIIKNAETYIKAGGRAHWDFIVFAHNEHQVEEAENLSKKLGFEKFQIKKSYRFFSPESGSVKDSVTSIDRKQNVKILQPPTNEKYLNQALKKSTDARVQSITVTTKNELLGRLQPQIFQREENKKSSVEKMYDNATIDCRVKKEKSVYISAEGVVQPCCWVGSQMYLWNYLPKQSQVYKLINKIGIKNISIHNKTLKEIIESDYFQKVIPESWTKSSCYDGKLQVCSMTCSKEMDMFAQQFS